MSPLMKSNNLFLYVRHTVLSRHAEQINPAEDGQSSEMGVNLALDVLECEKLGFYAGIVLSTSLECSLRNRQKQILH